MLEIKQNKTAKTAQKSMFTHIYKGRHAGRSVGFTDSIMGLLSMPVRRKALPLFILDYKKHYRLLIEKALNRTTPNCYTEKHHILPRCMGGPDEPANLVTLTAREHFVAHWLLHRAYPNHDGLAKAFGAMSFLKPNQSRYTPSSLAIAEAKEAAVKASILQNSKPVKQFSTKGDFIKEWGSAKDAAEALGICSSAIGKVCKKLKKSKTCGGYIWRYSNDEQGVDPYKMGKPVTQLDKDGLFINHWHSITEASKSTGASNAAIGMVCKGDKRHKTAGGFKWLFTSDYTKMKRKLNHGLVNAPKMDAI